MVLRLILSRLNRISCCHAGIYPWGLDVDVFTEFCLMPWRSGLLEDWRSLRHMHTVLISNFRAWAWLSSRSCCFTVHIGIASARRFPKVQAYVIIRRNASSVHGTHACFDHGFPKLWLLHAFCNSIPRTRDGRVT